MFWEVLLSRSEIRTSVDQFSGEKTIYIPQKYLISFAKPIKMLGYAKNLEELGKSL